MDRKKMKGGKVLAGARSRTLKPDRRVTTFSLSSSGSGGPPKFWLSTLLPAAPLMKHAVLL